jgi:hypothetical protein
LLCIDIAYSLEETKNGIDLSDIISVYYSLMEEIIIILSTASPFDDEGDDSDEDKRKEDIEPEFKNVIKVIVETLETIILFGEKNLKNIKYNNDTGEHNKGAILPSNNSSKKFEIELTNASIKK